MNPTLPPSLFRDLVTSAVDAVLIVDGLCRIRYANCALERLVGYGAGELTGEPLNGLLPEDVARRHDEYVYAYLESFHASTVLGTVREMQIRHRSGELIPVELKAIDLGCAGHERYFGAFLTDLRERKQLEQRNAHLMAQLQEQALTDALTGLPNRRAFDAEAQRVLAVARREARPVAVGIADIDHFKHVNDRYGHPAGDRVLCQVASILARHLRQGDFIARIGGEEFALLFRGASSVEAEMAAERLRLKVASTPITLPHDPPIHATVSIGIGNAEAGQPIAAALEQADQALYGAKNAGRNQVLSWRHLMALT